MKVCVVFCKSRKSFSKYVKNNGIKNKAVLDIKKILDEEEIKPSDMSKKFFRIVLWRKIEWAISRGKDIYYIPWAKSAAFKPNKTLGIKNILPSDVKSEMLMFYDDFKNDQRLDEICSLVQEFDEVHIVDG